VNFWTQILRVTTFDGHLCGLERVSRQPYKKWRSFCMSTSFCRFLFHNLWCLKFGQCFVSAGRWSCTKSSGISLIRTCPVSATRATRGMQRVAATPRVTCLGYAVPSARDSFSVGRCSRNLKTKIWNLSQNFEHLKAFIFLIQLKLFFGTILWNSNYIV